MRNNKRYSFRNRLRAFGQDWEMVPNKAYDSVVSRGYIRGEWTLRIWALPSKKPEATWLFSAELERRGEGDWREGVDMPPMTIEANRNHSTVRKAIRDIERLSLKLFKAHGELLGYEVEE